MLTELRPLLDAVRRRLLHARVARVLAVVGWSAAAWLGLCAVGQLTGAPAVHFAAVWGLGAIAGAGLLWLLWRRPLTADAALWADRHLGLASGCTTWLDLQRQPATASATHLEAWLRRELPPARERLARQPAPAMPARPLAAALITAALCWVLTGLPTVQAPAAAPALADAPPPVASVDRAAAPPPSAAATADLAQRVARALEPAPAAPTEAAAPGVDPPSAGRHLRPVEGRASAAGAVALDTDRPTPQARGAGAGGSDVGAQADDQARSSAAPAALAPLSNRRNVGQDEPSADAVDPGRAGRYADARADAGVARRAAAAAAPATPPPAEPGTPMSPTESNYVRAWLTNSTIRR
jgi:hypothetical protein